jgi:probable addiction module antidote protein
MKPKFRTFDDLLEEYLQNPEFALSFLNQAFADDGIDAFKRSLKDIIRVHGNITALAKEADVSRGTLYKLMEDKGQPEIGTVLKVFHALGYELTVTHRKPPRKSSRAAAA